MNHYDEKNIKIVIPTYLANSIFAAISGHAYDFMIEDKEDQRFLWGNLKHYGDEGITFITLVEAKNAMDEAIASESGDKVEFSRRGCFVYSKMELERNFENAKFKFFLDDDLREGSLCYIVKNTGNVTKKIIKGEMKKAAITFMSDTNINCKAMDEDGVEYSGLIYSMHYDESYGRYVFLSPKEVLDVFKKREERLREAEKENSKTMNALNEEFKNYWK